MYGNWNNIYKGNDWSLGIKASEVKCSDGNINIYDIKNIKKSESWIKNALENEDILLSEIFYAFYKNKKLYIIKKGS